VLALARESTFAAVQPGNGRRAYEVDGFVQGGPVRTLVAVNLAAPRPEPLETLDHEYVHLALGGALPAQPLWVSEGLAELLSDWHEADGVVLVGGSRPEHVRLLAERAPLPLARVLEAGYTSPEFTDAALRPVLYAQSWALVRMLLEGGDAAARERLLAFLASLAKGTAAPAAFPAAFGYDLAEAESRVRRSLAQEPPSIRVPAPPTSDTQPVIEPAPAGVPEALMGELLLRQERDGEARRRLEAALQRDPGLPMAHEALAHLALRRGRWDEARQHLEAARRREPDDPAALFRLADLLVREARARSEVLSGAAEDQAVRLLEQAVVLAPRYSDAVDLLAHLRPEPRALRIRMVEDALAHDPERTELAFTLAGLHLGGQDPRAAGAALVRARDTARDETHRFLAEHLLRRLGEATAGTMEARGRLVQLDCLPGGTLDFVVQADPGSITGGIEMILSGARARPAVVSRTLRLRAPTPTSVLLQDGSGDLLQRELLCGPQQGAVRVRYRPITDSPPGPPIDGMLLTLRFLPR
jgi:tetratricopeptide (TPR) repeat protein